MPLSLEALEEPERGILEHQLRTGPATLAPCEAPTLQPSLPRGAGTRATDRALMRASSAFFSAVDNPCATYCAPVTYANSLEYALLRILWGRDVGPAFSPCAGTSHHTHVQPGCQRAVAPDTPRDQARGSQIGRMGRKQLDGANIVPFVHSMADAVATACWPASALEEAIRNRESEAPAEPKVAAEMRLSRSFALPKTEFSDSLGVLATTFKLNYVLSSPTPSPPRPLSNSLTTQLNC